MFPTRECLAQNGKHLLVDVVKNGGVITGVSQRSQSDQVFQHDTKGHVKKAKLIEKKKSTPSHLSSNCFSQEEKACDVFDSLACFGLARGLIH